MVAALDLALSLEEVLAHDCSICLVKKCEGILLGLGNPILDVSLDFQHL